MEPAFKHPRFKREIPNNINDISKLFENFIDDKINELFQKWNLILE